MNRQPQATTSDSGVGESPLQQLVNAHPKMWPLALDHLETAAFHLDTASEYEFICAAVQAWRNIRFPLLEVADEFEWLFEATP